MLYLIHLLQLTNYSHLSFTPRPPPTTLFLSCLVVESYSFTLFRPCPIWHLRRLILFRCLIFYPWLGFLFPCLTPRLLCSSLSLPYITWLTLDLLRVPSSFYFVWRERKPTRCNNQMSIINFCLNMFHVSLCPSSRKQKTVCYCIWCTALVLLDVVGSGCGALRCRMRAVLVRERDHLEDPGIDGRIVLKLSFKKLNEQYGSDWCESE